MGNAKRQSGYEILRIISIMLIMMMHSFGAPLSVANDYVLIGVNVIGNVGTACFIIISGYFGVKRNIKKLVKLDLMIIVYCLIGFVVNYGLYGDMSLRELVSCVIPIVSHRYWFLSCYFFLCILSPYINAYLESVDRRTFEGLLGTMLLLFVILPTVFGFDVMQDGGKGLVNMTIYYMLGRYIAKYVSKSSEEKGSFIGKLFGKAAGMSQGLRGLAFFSICGVNYLLNAGVFFATGSNANYYARDNSLFTVCEAVLLFMIFMNIKISSSIINGVAANVVAVYVLEPVISHVIRHFVDYTVLAGYIWYVGLVILVVVGTFVIGVLIEAVRKLVFSKVEDKILDNIIDGFMVKIWKQ